MDKNDIKKLQAGQVVYLQNYPVTFKRRTMTGIVVNDDVAEDSDGNMCYFPAKYIELECFCPENDIKNTDTAPKYDPCRKFRKGDKAKPTIINGRGNQKMPLSVIFTVTGDEDEYGAVPVEYMSPVRGLLTSTTVHAVWLELVTPVEELGPYSVRHNEAHAAWSIYGPYNLSAVNYFYGERYPYTEEAAKAAAEAERDRLNAEHRKEQE